MPETMPAFRITAWERPPELVEAIVPVPGPGQVLVEVAGNGLCHSDIIMGQMPAAIGEAIGWAIPFTLGHETAGRVAAVGPGVRAFGVGAPVACMSPTSCGVCDLCVTGHDNCCPHGLAGRGYGRDGGLARYVLVESERELVPLATLDPSIAGVLVDAGATSYHAVARVLPRLVPGTTAVVIGAGGLGSFAVQYLRALSSARVVVVDQNPARLEYAIELGAHDAIPGVDRETATAVRACTAQQRGAAAVLDFVGTDESIRSGLAATAVLGAFGLVGAGGGGVGGHWQSLLPRGGEVFTFQGPTIADTRRAIALAEAGLVRLDVERYALSDVARAYADLDAGVLRGRAVVSPDPSGS